MSGSSVIKYYIFIIIRYCHHFMSIRKLPPGSIIQQRIVAEPSHALFDDVVFSSMFSRRFSSNSSTTSNFSTRRTSQWRIRFQVQQCRTPSTNCTKSSPDELHQHSTKEECPSTMLNSIDARSHNGASVSKFNNVELHRPTVRSPVQSNSINTRSRKYARQQCRTPSTVEIPTDNNVELHRLSDADPSCVQFRDSSRTIRHGESNLQRGLVLRAIERKSKTNLVKKSNYTVRT